MNMFRKTITVLLILMLMLAAGCSGRDSSSGTAPDDEQSYADLIFDTSLVHTVDVSLSEGDRVDASGIIIKDMGTVEDLKQNNKQ